MKKFVLAAGIICKCLYRLRLHRLKKVNASHPGFAARIQIEDLDHLMLQSNTFEEAARNFKEQAYAKGNFKRKIAVETISWLNKVYAR